jgi:hypothetical protein
MKFLIALSLLVTSVASIASTRSIFDLQYLPKAGTLFGTTDASVTNTNIYIRTVKADIDANQLSQTVGFSVMDNLLLSVSANYLESSLKVSNSDTVRTRGLSDATVAGKFRLMDDAYIFDILADYLISTGDSEVNGSQTRYDNKAGGGIANVAAQFGSKSADFQWAVLARFTRFFEATQDISGAGDNDSKAHNAYYVEGSTLMNLSFQDWKFKTTLSALSVDGYKDDSESNASVTQIGLAGEWQYVCSTNLLARAGVGLTETITDRIQQYNSWKFNVGATYQF